MHLAAARESDSVVLAIGGVLAREDLRGLVNWLETLLERRPATTVVCDVGGLTTVDLVAVDALAQLRLVSARLGCTLVVRGAPRPMRTLVEFVGLADVLPFESPLGVETRREIEQREQELGVEEERDAGDLTA